MKIDMHMHSSASPDGQFRPSVLMRKSKKAGIEVAAITDHDTVVGVNEVLDNGYSDDYPKIFIPAIELSVSILPPHMKKAGGRMHILGYEIDRRNSKLLKMLEMKAEYRRQNIETYLEVLREKYGIIFSKEERKTQINSRVDIARLIAQKNQVDRLSTVYSNFIVPMDELIEEKGYPLFGVTAEEVIKTIIEAGGYPTLAHAITLKLPEEKLREKIAELQEMGLCAIEIQHPSHSNEYRELLMKIAEKYNLLVTHGSDFHGEIKPDIELGSGGPGNGHPLNSIHATESSLVSEIIPKRLSKMRK